MDVHSEKEPCYHLRVKTRSTLARQIDSVSCLRNSWERDWWSSNNRTYPKDKENEIITAYYNKQGITIFSVKTKFTQPKFMCTACSCGNGYTFYLLILDSDVGKMLSYDYKVA